MSIAALNKVFSPIVAIAPPLVMLISGEILALKRADARMDRDVAKTTNIPHSCKREKTDTV